MKLKILTSAICFLAGLTACQEQKLSQFQIVRVIDGDSMQVQDHNGHTAELRLMGIDAPEYSQDPWGKRSYAFSKNHLENGSTIYVELYPQRDQYNRYLGYLFYGQDPKSLTMLNNEILANGFAEIYIRSSDSKYVNLFKQSQAQAKAQGLNIWQANNGLTMSPAKYRQKHKNKTYNKQ